MIYKVCHTFCVPLKCNLAMPFVAGVGAYPFTKYNVCSSPLFTTLFVGTQDTTTLIIVWVTNYHVMLRSREVA
ncbi:MAG: hypothetical protein WC449_05305 [Candidatus Paceibacterota bacterium]